MSLKYRTSAGTSASDFTDLVVKVGDTLPIGTEVDYDGQSAPAGWEEVDDPSVYSTTETRIGTWIDGKPLYRKIFTGTTPTSAGQHQAVDLPSTIDAVTNFYFQTKSSSGYYINYTYAEMGTVQLSVALQVTTSNKRLYFGTLISSYASQPYTLIVEYTKSTD